MNPAGLHQFRIATMSDRADVLLFLQQQWNENHIYLKSDTLFNYDLIVDNRLNFILAINDANVIDGILGFIPYDTVYQGCDILTVLWKARPKNGDPMLGVTLLSKLIEDYGFRVVSTVGANKKTLPIYEFLGYTVGQLKHYFIINEQLASFGIIQGADKVPGRTKPTGDKQLISFSSYAELGKHFNASAYATRVPYKSPWYIRKRYFEHPFYSYKVLGIVNADGSIANSILIAREVKHEDAKVLRIVDFIGDETDLRGIGNALSALLQQSTYEYVDFYQFGIDHETMTAAGFLLKDDYKELVIPNYFEPFQQSNVQINFFTTAQEPFYFFKADGDQDRPNQILK